MRLTKVNSLWQSVILMFIRNDCREFMTHDQSKITLHKQLKWFNDINSKMNFAAYIFWNGIIPIGYGLFKKRQDDDRVWISGGILKVFRGKHFGSMLFEKLINIQDGELWLDVFKTNTAAIRIYKKLGFRKVSEDINQYGQIIIMKIGKRRDYV